MKISNNIDMKIILPIKTSYLQQKKLIIESGTSNCVKEYESIYNIFQCIKL